MNGPFQKSEPWSLEVCLIGGCSSCSVQSLCHVGAGVGGVRGLYAGLTDPAIKQLPTLAIRRTQVLNHVTKSGGTLAQTTGSIGLIYALADFFVHKIRGGADDELNTVTAATATGCIYKSRGEW